MRANARDFDGIDLKLKEFMPWVKETARCVAFKMKSVDCIDDLVQCGLIALSRILQENRFDDSMGYTFKTFAEKRLRGSMIDEIRSRDFISQRERVKINGLMKKINTLSNEFGKKITLGDISKVSEISIDECCKLIALNKLTCEHDSIEELFESGAIHYMNELVDDKSPEKTLMEKENKIEFYAAVKNLPKRQRLAVHLCLKEEINHYIVSCGCGAGLYDSIKLAKKTLKKQLKGLVNV